MEKFKEALLASLILALLGTALAAVIAYRQSIRDLVGDAFLTDVSIATTPAGAEVIFDGKPAGTSPVKVSARATSHTIEVRKDGYETLSQAFDVAWPTKQNPNPPTSINLQLKQSSAPAKVATPPTASLPQVTPNISPKNYDKELSEIRSMILANPEESVTVGALKERVNLLSEQSQALREEVKDLRSESKWFLGTLIFAFLAIITLIVPLLLRGSKGNA